MINWKKELNDEQYSAVTSFGKPLLVLAGAGSGKTRVLTYRVAYMVEEQKIKAESILLLTFTNKAAGEMKERVIKLVGRSPGFAGTFHSFAAKLLRQYGTALGWNRGFVIYDETDKLTTIKSIMKKMDIDTKLFKPQAVGGAISAAKNEMLNAGDYLVLAKGPFQQKTAEIWQEYQNKLTTSQAMDFDDLLTESVKLLSIDEVRQKINETYQEILVDEYQDTNKAQYLMTKLLVNGRDGLTVVGDFSQSIYSFRGADFRNISYLERDFSDLITIKLEQNYRSTQTILDAAYGVIGQNTGHPILHLKATNKVGEAVELYEARDEKEEALFIVNKVLAAEGKIAVLYRTNAQSRAVEEALIRAGIAYVLVGGTRFYERKEVKDVLGYLRVVANPLDSASWERIEKNGIRRMNVFKTWLTELDKSVKLTTSEYLNQVLKASAYLERYNAEDEEDLSRIENVKELLNVATEFEDLTDFLENVTLVQSESQSALKENAKVTLMTIHAAKGLEYDEVVVIGMEENLFPHSRALMDKEQMEEERRLCYVALTRAREKLSLSYARQRLVFGTRNSAIPSRFLSEIPKHLIQTNQKTSPYSSPRLGEEISQKPVVIDQARVTRLVADDFDEIDSW